MAASNLSSNRMAGVGVSELITNSTPSDLSGACRHALRVTPRIVIATRRVILFTRERRGAEGWAKDSGAWVACGVWLIRVRMAIVVALCLLVLWGHGAARNLYSLIQRIHQGSIFLAPCAVEEARTRCRLLPLKYSLNSDATLSPLQASVQQRAEITIDHGRDWAHAAANDFSERLV